MLVSIIIPIYNVAQYLKQCLQSVVEQTYQDLEVILVDDCGTDDSIKEAESFINNYYGVIRFHIIHHQYNKGAAAARNTGINVSSGDWLYFLDGDDWITQDCIESLVDCVTMHSDTNIVFAGASATCSGYEYMDLTKKQLPDYSNSALWIKAMMLRRSVFSTVAWNRLVNKTFIINNNLYFQEGYSDEDEIWNFRLSQHVKRASICRKNTYFYRINPDGTMRSRSILQTANVYQKLCDLLLCEICPPLEEEQAISIWNICSDAYNLQELPLSARARLKSSLLELKQYYCLGLKVLFRIYLFSPKLFYFLSSTPKIRGYINIKLKHNNSYL